MASDMRIKLVGCRSRWTRLIAVTTMTFPMILNKIIIEYDYKKNKERKVDFEHFFLKRFTIIPMISSPVRDISIVSFIGYIVELTWREFLD